MTSRPIASLACALAALFAAPAAAQDRDDRPRRVRVGLGPQIVPSYPGSDRVVVRPFIDVSRARGDDPFAFEAADESFGFSVLRRGGFSVGPALNFEGSRTARDVGAALPKVGASFEAGAFMQYQLRPDLRLRVEGRKGLTGHEGWVGSLGADYVARRGDEWLLALGPRLTVADGRFHRAYFGVGPEDAAASGLPAFRAKGGVQAVGATASLLRQLTRRWGLSSYARYDRLVADAARSPVTRSLGSRNQFSVGLAATYTFGRAVD